MNQHTDSAEPSASASPKRDDVRKPASIHIITVGHREGIVIEGTGSTATVAVAAAELVWIGRNVKGDITEILWDPEAAIFQPEHFETLRSKSPFIPFSVLIRSGGPSTIVRSASELFVGQEALIVRSADRTVVTIPLCAIKAIEMPPGLAPSTRPANSRTDSDAVEGASSKHASPVLHPLSSPTIDHP